MNIFDDKPENCSAIKLDCMSYIDNNGKICDLMTENRLNCVVKVISGTIHDVIHLIGHSKSDIQPFMNNNILYLTNEVKSKLQDLIRAPGSYLVEDREELYGVIIDSKNQSKIVGVVRDVIPGEHNDGYYKAVNIAKDGTFSFCNLKDYNIKDLANSGAFIGMTCLDGFIFLQTEVCGGLTKPLRELILILQNGYFVISADLKWTRVKTSFKKDQVESRSTTFEAGDCFIARRGGCVRNTDGFEIFGSGNAILRFNAFWNFLSSVKAFGLESKKCFDGSKYGIKIEEEAEEGDFVSHTIVRHSYVSMEDNAITEKMSA